MSEFLHRLPEFVGNHPFLSFGFVGVAAALVASEFARLTRGWKAATPADVTNLINRENALVVDLASAADFEKGHIPGARHVALAQFDPENKDLAKVRELPVVVYCRNGQSSSQAARRLVKAGFTRVYELDGGLRSWVDAQLPLAKGRNKG